MKSFLCFITKTSDVCICDKVLRKKAIEVKSSLIESCKSTKITAKEKKKGCRSGFSVY